MSSHAKCFSCGFVDWAGRANCRRCGNSFYRGGSRARHDSPTPARQEWSHTRVGGGEALFTGSVRLLVWATGIGVSALLLARMQDEKLGLVVAAAMALVGGLAAVAGTLMYVVETFRAGILWGVGSLFFLPVSLLFLFAHWHSAKRPFAISTLGSVMLLIGLLA